MASSKQPAKQPGKSSATAGKGSGTSSSKAVKQPEKPAAKSASKSAAKSAAKSKSKKTSSPDQYTEPELREKIKRDVMAGSKGGNPGQWSARKAQLVASEYTREGGGYKHERDETQEHLHEWTGEHWQTSDGEPAKRAGGTTRYLPEAAWKDLSPAEKKATNRKKVDGSQHGKQFVANTAPAADARRSATKHTPAKKKPAAPRKSTRAASSPHRAG